MFDYRPQKNNPYHGALWDTLGISDTEGMDLNDSFYRQLLLHEVYDLAHGIYQGYVTATWHDPMARIGMHPTEDVLNGSLYDRWLKLFTKYGIAELFNISFIEFIEGDMLSCIGMLEMAKEATGIKRKALDGLEELKGQLNDSSKKTKHNQEGT